jgi:hypothetical protein
MRNGAKIFSNIKPNEFVLSWESSIYYIKQLTKLKEYNKLIKGV